MDEFKKDIPESVSFKENEVISENKIAKETVTAKENIETELSQEVLKAFVEQSEEWNWTEENLHEKLEKFRADFKEKGYKPKFTMWGIRAAVTGRTCGADMVATLVILGKENSLARAKKAIK